MADESALKQLQQKLEKLLDMMKERDQENQQNTLNEHDDKVSEITTRIQYLLTKVSKDGTPSSNPDLELKRRLHETFD